MAPKTTLGKTNKYSGVVKSVQNNQPEEPKITSEQVTSTFHSFGFVPNARNHNDIGYWTTKGKSELPKLVEELHKRRMDINNGQDAIKKIEDLKNKSKQDILDKHNESKVTLPRLSDKDITALYDEYGLPAPDPEWARNHLPNDPKKIRSILDMQRKTADDMLKKHSKNSVNSIPEVPKTLGNQGISTTPTGMGGPTPLGMQAGMVGDTSPATPFFIGDHSIVRIANQSNPNASTTWLVDAKRKILRPFASEEAFNNAFENPEEAKKAIVNISTKELGQGGALSGFKPLQGHQGVKDDGSMDNIPFTDAQLQNRYGKPADPAAENKALSMLDGIFSKMNPQQSQQ